MKEKIPYSVPEGYFESLESRLSEIPSSTSRKSYFPSFAFATAVVAVLLVSGMFFFKEQPSTSTTIAQKTETEAIVDYLIDSGTPLSYLEDN